MNIVVLSILLLCNVCLHARSWQSKQKELRQKKRELALLQGKANTTDSYKTVALQAKETAIDCDDNGQVLDRDYIIARVAGPEREHVVCQSELERPTVNGAPADLQTIINDELIFQEAMRYKMPIDDSIADKYILSICQQHKLSIEDVNNIFKSAGMTPEEGRQSLIKMQIKDAVIGQKIMSRVFVPQQEVESYYQDNMIIKPAKYQLQIALIPYDPSMSPEQQNKQIIEQIKQGKGNLFDWSESVWLKEDDIAQDKQFILTMKPQRISMPQATSRGFELTLLRAKKEAHPVSLDKQFRLILGKLREQKAEIMIQQFMQDLQKNAVIAYTPAV